MFISDLITFRKLKHSNKFIRLGAENLWCSALLEMQSYKYFINFIHNIDYVTHHLGCFKESSKIAFKLSPVTV